MNDLNKSLTLLRTIHFAEDTTLYLDLNPTTDCTSLINSELVQVQTWINANKLSLKVQKTNWIKTSKRNQIENKCISLSGQSIARTSNHKLLGVFIDEKLNFNKHISKLYTKVSQSIRIMKRISHLVPVNVLRNLFFTLIYSRLTFANIAWWSAFNSTTRRIETLIPREYT